MKTLRYANGDQMPALGLGTWKSAPGDVYAAVRKAIQLGYRNIDCATVYGNEAEIGLAIKDELAASELTRDELWITSKLWNNAHKQADVRPGLQKTLDDLQLDYLDLYLIHWPVVFKPEVVFPRSGSDYLTLDEVPVAETWQGLEACVNEGLVRHIGVSNFSQKKLEALFNGAQIKPGMNQVELHPLLSQSALKTYCDANNIFMTAFSPLGSKDRPDDFKANAEPDLMELQVIKDIAAAKGVTCAQILLAWAVNRGTAVIPKSVNPGRLQLNLEAASIELTAQEMQSINELNKNYRYVDGSFWTAKDSPYTFANIWDE